VPEEQYCQISEVRQTMTHQNFLICTKKKLLLLAAYVRTNNKMLEETSNILRKRRVIQ
jgi:hypothetical protein